MKLSERLDASAKRPAPIDAGAASKLPPGPLLQRRGGRWDSERAMVRSRVIDELGPRLAGDASLADGDLEAEIVQVIDQVLADAKIAVPAIDRARFTRSVLSDLIGYGPLDALLHDPDIDEIMCNAFDDVWVERHGRLERTDVAFLDNSQFLQVIERMVAAVGRRVDESSPMVDARLPDGSRINAVLPPVTVKGPTLTIRKFRDDPLTMHDLLELGSVSEAAAELLQACVRGRLNVVISGGTGTGKTTLLNVLSAFVPADERIITIEDAAELQLQQPHVISMESRPANAEGVGEVTIRDLVRNALRMRPDRIVVGEVRGGESLDMLQAMNTGHEGSLTTVHANSPRDAVARIETLCLMAGLEIPEPAVRAQLSSALDVVVQLARLPDGRRRLVSICEVQGVEHSTVLLQDVFTFNADADRLEPTGLRPAFADKLRNRGITLPRAALSVAARSAVVPIRGEQQP